jgi:hypothetical protein
VNAPLCRAGPITVTPERVEAALCRCLHGCGPGIEASIAIRADNPTARPARIGWSFARYTSLDFLAGEDRPLSYQDGPEGCCSAGLRRAYGCGDDPRAPWDGTVAAGYADELRLSEHFDVTDVDHAGRYRVELGLTIDGQLHVVDLGVIDLAAAPPLCE